MKNTLYAVLFASFSPFVLADSQAIELGDPEPAMTDASMEVNSEVFYEEAMADRITIASDRITIFASKSTRGRTVSIPQFRIDELCGDIDGCQLRMAMYNWDGKGRTASRSNLFYYNKTNRAWRAENGDKQGTDFNGKTEHIMQSWSCYFTDGTYRNWKNTGDSAIGFSLLSWNQYNADCRLTIID
ncbi:hypothetical protein [Zooshikella harenae]|uniref:Uncharacterized protein n=1 Tax=Zooshikella harenae TaxID=2827238 RepID=A0ABS5ZJH7_9GAMM|nr:hypothetical protein [Zooshikella harenae]MBU2713142.1 hypothetical protein [Zooshikella harenae]